ncbi:hypothetical protein MAPG_00125 [Magnaporthiopsis poae ATCC 64411]|uniref:C2H2-type domain-containing protein n=1 Tax=Magnaporthiopsis poae (strain ATCC 64411 / 73-15) TaxID=644358 RepID=A0A0C4DK62_MAGP6|nr:hypothetical protein MAPG_00125 [Magnaporthiopsis poae ATCC 64411]
MSVVDDDDAKIAPLPSDVALAVLRGSAMQCRKLLHELSAGDDAAAYETEDMMAAFNILAANMGIFRQGQHSLASRLQNAPEIASLVRQLLDALQRHLVYALAEGDNGSGRTDHTTSCGSESDDSSDRSSVSSGRLDVSKAVEEQEAVHTGHGPSAALTSARGTINSLRQLSLTIRLAGAQHRSERIRRFRAQKTYSQVFDVFRMCALQRARHLFPLAPEFLVDRIAESIASRRIRFLYLERHQMKISTLNQPAPTLLPIRQQQESSEKHAAEFAGQSEPQRTDMDLAHSSVQPSIILSSTEITKLEPKGLRAAAQFKAERAESVSSIQVSHGEFPKMPNLDPGGLSFTCPYCLLVCPVREAGHNYPDDLITRQYATGEKRQGTKRLEKSQWRNHLVRDFEPFFCVLEDCSSPFACADTYNGWLAHLKDKHSPPTWRCWHCGPQATVSFSSPGEHDGHLREHHGHAVSDAHRPALVKHSMIRKQGGLHSCPFCGGFPEEIEQRFPDRQSSQAQEALIAHVKAHLISVALLLAPIRAEGTNDDGIGSDASSDVRGCYINSARGGPDSDSDVQYSVDILCHRLECDCKTSSRVPAHDIPEPAQSIPGWDLEDARLVAAINEKWLDVKKAKQQEAGLDEPDWLEQPVVKSFSQRLRQDEAGGPPPFPIVSKSAQDVEADHTDTPASMASLAAASSAGHSNIVKMLLERGADVNAQDSEYDNALQAASSAGHGEIVKMLLEKGADVKAEDVDRRTPLWIAAGNGHEAVVELLIKNGAAIDQSDDSGHTPLSKAAGNGHEAVARLLMELGADKEAESRYRFRPLHYAARDGREGVTRLLIELGADKEAEKRDRMRPLHLAALNGHKAVVKLLVELGADKDARDERGRTPLDIAKIYGHGSIARVLE